MAKDGELLWTPSEKRVANSPMSAFAREVSARTGRDISDYAALHGFSIDHREEFWDLVWDFTGIVGDKGQRALTDDRMPGARFFPDGRLNFAENLLAKAGPDSADALVFWGEDRVKRRMSWKELRDLVAQLQQALSAAGVGQGDRVAGMLPNLPEAIAAMLAVSSLGAVWSSCSPDFGVRGVLDRFGQIEPKVLFVCDGYYYADKSLDVSGKVAEIVADLPTVQTTVVIPYLGTEVAAASSIPNAVTLGDFLSGTEVRAPEFLRLPLDHPLSIMFSSGTTGVPKCIVHSAGGALLQQLKEHVLHSGNGPDSKVFYFTTLGWMMWNWLIAGLATGATLLLYDGSPFHPSGNILFDYADAEGMTFFGTSAKFIDSVKKAGLRPTDSHDLGTVQTMASTGSPLSAESFAFVYDGIKQDIHLASISGGTDILSCFVLGNPNAPVYSGEIQVPGLGMATDVWDESGNPIRQQKGELVCTRAFPSMPISFWNDPDGKKYRAAYFDRFEGVWCHGDFAEWTDRGGMVIHGRSDATLNPGGVRIGTAEIYAQVEQLPQITEALAIGQDWDDDVRVVLFVRLAKGVELDDDLQKLIRTRIRNGASPRHVPARIVAVEDIPRTKSGKITELAVRDVVHGRTVKNVEALANPEALGLYQDIPELSE
ncbi:MAG: acetoacetate--CoA ligase [Pseudomonadota bacterium]